MVELQEGDRVVVAQDGKLAKGRVATVNAELKRYGVTFKKDEQPVIFLREQIFPLYRYVHAEGEILPGVGVQVVGIAPLFFDPKPQG